MSDRRTLTEQAADLAAGRTTSRELVEACLARIADPAGEGKRAFVKVWAKAAREVADAQDRLRKNGVVASPIAGIPVSVKDLFDVAGEVTLAGSKALDDAAPAEHDAPIVQRLKAAGAVLVGRTNMTEFAFSGVGINPHYGTPGNPFDRARIPGGSSSGAAVAAADGMCTISIGSDTGGSVRIPSALCGITGFKPSQYRVSRHGAVPLSTTLDSIGPLGLSVADCALVDAVMAGEEPVIPVPVSPAGLRLAVPQTLVLDDLEPAVAHAFERAGTRLSRAGAVIRDERLAELGEIPEINAKGGFTPPEALAWHKDLLARRGRDYDPRVKARIERGQLQSAVDYVELCWKRQAIIERFDRATAGFDALLLPTLPIVAPPIAAFAKDDDFTHLNLLLLRNPSLFNFLDRCAVTLPIEVPGEAPVGLMLVGARGADRHLLAVARGVEAALRE